MYWKVVLSHYWEVACYNGKSLGFSLVDPDINSESYHLTSLQPVAFLNLSLEFLYKMGMVIATSQDHWEN